MNAIDNNICREREKLEHYGKAVTSLLLKKEYNNFLNIYLKLLYESLLKYNALNQAKLENETTYAIQNTEEDKKDEKE